MRRSRAFDVAKRRAEVVRSSLLSFSRSESSSNGALMSVSGVRMSCAVLTKKRILSSDIFRCLRNTIMRNAMLAIATRISAYSNNAHMLSQMGCSTIISMLVVLFQDHTPVFTGYGADTQGVMTGIQIGEPDDHFPLPDGSSVIESFQFPRIQDEGG